MDGMKVMSSSATSLTVSGVPSAPANLPNDPGGLYHLNVTATYPTNDQTGPYTTTQEFLIDVSPSGPSFAVEAATPTPGSNVLPPATLGQTQPYSVALNTEGANASDTYAFGLAPKGSPSWLTITQDATTGVWTLGGSPPATDFPELANVIVDAVDTTTGVVESRVFQLPIVAAGRLPDLQHREPARTAAGVPRGAAAGFTRHSVPGEHRCFGGNGLAQSDLPGERRL